MSDIIYLDNAATTFPKPEVVYRAMDHFYRHLGVNPGRSGYDLCVEAGEVVEDARRTLTRFFGGTDPHRLCFGYNSTDALNLVIFGMLQPGDHAITTVLEHNSVLRPLHHLMTRQQVEVDHVPCNAHGFVDPDDIRKRIRKNTRLVIVNHASNVIGTVQPVADIGKACREAGVPFAIDASQSAGKVKIDVETMNIDVVVFTGHKSLFGPTGIGGLYVRPGVEIRHTRAGGTGVRSATREHLEEYPYRLEYGTVNSVGVAGLLAGVQWLEAQGMEAVHAHEMRLATLLREGLRDAPNVALYMQDSLENHIAVTVFNIKGLEAMNTGTLLDVDHNIACRTGLHCAPLVHDLIRTSDIGGAVRFGIGPFNTEADIQAAVHAVREVGAARGGKV